MQTTNSPFWENNLGQLILIIIIIIMVMITTTTTVIIIIIIIIIMSNFNSNFKGKLGKLFYWEKLLRIFLSLKRHRMINVCHVLNVMKSTYGGGGEGVFRIPWVVQLGNYPHIKAHHDDAQQDW
jgi:hypothetical protein